MITENREVFESIVEQVNIDIVGIEHIAMNKLPEDIRSNLLGNMSVPLEKQLWRAIT